MSMSLASVCSPRATEPKIPIRLTENRAAMSSEALQVAAISSGIAWILVFGGEYS